MIPERSADRTERPRNDRPLAWRRSGANKEVSEARARISVGLVVVLCVAAVSRFWGLGEWPLEGDEVFTYTRCKEGDFLRINPGIYVAGTAAFRVLGESVFVARLPSAVFGVLGILALWWLGREVRGERLGILAAMLGVVSFWHLYQSQQARFYTAAFFFSATAYWLALRGWRRCRLFDLVIASVSGGVAALFHGSALVVLALLGVFAVGGAVIRSPSEDGERRRVVRAAAWIHVALGLIAIPPAAWIVLTWLSDSDSAIGGWGKSPLMQCLAWARYVTLPVSVAFVGYWILPRRDPPWRVALLGLIAAAPVGLLVLGAGVVDMRPDFAFFCLPVWLLLAGLLIEEAWERGGRPFGLCCALLVVAPQGPDFVSHYVGRASLDVRDAVDVVVERLQPGDALLAYDVEVKFYAAGRVPLVPWLGGSHSEGAEGWSQKLSEVSGSSDGRLWVILRRRRDPVAPSLEEWLFSRTRLVWEKSATRFDYSVDRIQIFLADGGGDG